MDMTYNIIGHQMFETSKSNETQYSFEWCINLLWALRDPTRR